MFDMNCMHFYCVVRVFLGFWKFPETAWRAVHSCQASHALWLIFGFLKSNRLAINSRPPGNTYQFYPIFCVFMKGLAVVI